MKTKAKQAITKGGKPFIAKDEEVTVIVNQSNPSAAIITTVSGEQAQLNAIRLGKYFKGFISPDKVDKFLLSEKGYDSAIVPSLTNKDVEPDGWDQKGFPSILLAAGMI